MLLHYHYPGDGVHELGNAFMRPAASRLPPLRVTLPLHPGTYRSAFSTVLPQEPTSRDVAPRAGGPDAVRSTSTSPPAAGEASCRPRGRRRSPASRSPSVSKPATCWTRSDEDALRGGLAGPTRCRWMRSSAHWRISSGSCTSASPSGSSSSVALVALGMGWPTTAPPHVARRRRCDRARPRGRAPALDRQTSSTGRLCAPCVGASPLTLRHAPASGRRGARDHAGRRERGRFDPGLLPRRPVSSSHGWSATSCSRRMRWLTEAQARTDACDEEADQ